MSENKKKETSPENVRVGVFICDCGSNIAGHLDCTSVTEYAADLPGVVYAKENLYTCSESGIVEIKDAIKEHDLNRVVVASCSPRTHHPLFSGSCAEAGLNPYLFEMVNIRDQCSWVHMGKREEATSKAKDLVRMGVAKSIGLEPQQDIASSLTRSVLVIGGGLAGLSAADALAAMGLDVTLVEKSSRPGGLLNAIDRLAGGDKAAERIEELMASVNAKENITVLLKSQVKSIGGYIGNYDVSIEGPEGQTALCAGCIVVATGAQPLIPKDLYGYDGKTVISQMELEQRFKKGGVDASKIVMIQCAGTRDDNREYCSRICCMTAVKNAMFLKEQNPFAEITVLYRDMQMYGTEKEQMLWDARGMGIRFDVYDPENPPKVEEGKVSYLQAVMGEEREVAYDMAVLSPPMVPTASSGELAQMMRVPTDQNGFFLEAHAKLRPLDFAADGIFVCGSARYPATTDEAMSQGIGVSSRVASILFKDELITDAIVAEIKPETCAGCLGCLGVCPYEAISFDGDKRVCRVNEILCKGCGNCAATCPSHSAVLKGYKPEQLLAQIRVA